jgi:hypothetical protein
VIIKKNRFNLVNYATGSNDYYFVNSIAKANLNFEMIESSAFAEYIDVRMLLINDSAPGYKPEKLNMYLDFIKAKKGLEGINWSEKDKVRQILVSR